MNNTIVIGNLGSDPQIRNSKNGEFMTFSLADNNYYGGENKTQWFDVSVFDTTLINRFKATLKKGSNVVVSGTFIQRMDEVNGKTYAHLSFTANSINYNSSGSGRTENTQTQVGNVAASKADATIPADINVPMTNTPSTAPAPVQDESSDLPF